MSGIPQEGGRCGLEMGGGPFLEDQECASVSKHDNNCVAPVGAFASSDKQFYKLERLPNKMVCYTTIELQIIPGTFAQVHEQFSSECPSLRTVSVVNYLSVN